MAITTKGNASMIPTFASNVAKKATSLKVVTASVEKVVDESQKWISKKMTISHKQKKNEGLGLKP